MAVKYLDNAGTQYLVNKIKAIDGKIPTESQITTMITTALNTYKEGIVTIVESLPQTGEEGKLYLVLDPSDSDVYIIYTWEENAFKRMGSKTFTLTVDSALSSTSTNPVQNKVVKTALDGKANASHTHGSITNDGKLGTASRVVITGTDKKIGISTVTTTQLGYLSGVTSAIQTQLDGKSATGHTHTAGDVAGLATVATTGSYNDLSDKPSIPTKTSDLTNDSNFVDTSNPAVASGITSAKVTDYDSHIADTDIHVTTADKTKWNNGVSQSYVLRYSSSSVTDNSTVSYSTLDNTDNVKTGDKVIGVDGKIFSVVSVDTVNQTVTVGSALIDLALDGNVVHTSGNETVGGVKTFSDNPLIGNNNTNITISNRQITANSSYSTPTGSGYSFMQLKAIVNYADSSPSINATVGLSIQENAYSDGKKAGFYPNSNNTINLGLVGRRWANVYATNYYYGGSEIEFSTKFVTTDTAQNVIGRKTFIDNTYLYNSDNTGNTPYLVLKSSKAIKGDTTGSNADASRITHVDKNNQQLNYIQFRKVSNGSSDITFYCSTLDTNNQDISSSIAFFKDVSGQSNFRSGVDNDISLGNTSYKWKDVQTKLINGLTPSSLSMPSARIDISSYFTNTGSSDTNTYTVPANGFIYLSVTDVVTLHVFSQTSGGLTNYGDTRGRNSVGLLNAFLPVRKDDVFVSQWYTTLTNVSLRSAYFIPCQGNV